MRVRMITHVRVHITQQRVNTRSNTVYVRISISVPRPTQGQNESLVFEGSFLKSPRAVLLHATAIHCRCGTDIEDRCLVFRSEVSFTDLPRIQISIQAGKIEKWTSELNYHEESNQDEEFVATT